MNSYSDTIIALSTPPGRSALAVVRISGSAVLEILKFLNHSVSFENLPRKAVYTELRDVHSEIIDNAVVIYYKNPNSYTGEDLAEISLHGNPLIIRRLIGSCLTVDNVRPADAGEFTLRAYMNGKMDLTQAEAVRRIIDARSDRELESGRRMLSGEFSRQLARFRSHLLNLKAEAEAEVDFAGEDLIFKTRDERKDVIYELLKQIDNLTESSRRALKYISDFRIVFAGAPNAGKSSLLNRLIGWDRAMVSEIAGTTRDFITENIEIDGIPVRMVDTAGLRESDDILEKEGIRRSKKEINDSSLIIFVIDTGNILNDSWTDEKDELIRISNQNPGKVFLILNKSEHLTDEEREQILEKFYILNVTDNSGISTDDPEHAPVFISCTTGTGIRELNERLRFWIHEKGRNSEDIMLLEDRHIFHLEKTAEALRKVINLWDEGAPDEIAAIEIDSALNHTGSITGTVTTEEVLGRVFSLFCIGK
jgi:tRNA modification GTPase